MKLSEHPRVPVTFGSVRNIAEKIIGISNTDALIHQFASRHKVGIDDDMVVDTPLSDGPNYGCPQYPTKRCDSNDMTMNYMDYTDDACMHMFTDGQVSRMRAVFTEGGGRESFAKN